MHFSQLVALEFRGKVTTVGIVQLVPVADALVDFHGYVEIVSQNAAQGARRERALRDQARVQQQALIVQAQPAAQAVGAHADQVEEGVRKGIGPLITGDAELVEDRRAVFLPGPIEQRYQAVVEEIEKGSRVSSLAALRAIIHSV